MFKELQEINKKPNPFQFYTAEDLWTDEYTSRKMLECHLNESIDAASRNTQFINRSVEWIAKHFKINDKSSIIDFGCGPGLYTSRFAKKGANVTGIDFSKRSLEYAKKEALKSNFNINYVYSNYLDFNTNEKFDLITLIWCDFTVLSPLQREKLLKKFYSLLKPDGSILLDIYSLNYFKSKKEFSKYEFNQQNKFWSPNDYYCFVNSFKYDQENLLLDKYTIIEKSSKKVIYNWYQCFSKESIKKEFKDNNLNIVEFYSDVAGTSYNKESDEFAIVAKKA